MTYDAIAIWKTRAWNQNLGILGAPTLTGGSESIRTLEGDIGSVWELSWTVSWAVPCRVHFGNSRPFGVPHPATCLKGPKGPHKHKDPTFWLRGDSRNHGL